MKKNYKGSIAVVMSAGLLPLAAQVAQADSNPFALSELSSAYMQTAEAKPADDASKMKDGACGEGKCGAAMMKPAAKRVRRTRLRCDKFSLRRPKSFLAASWITPNSILWIAHWLKRLRNPPIPRKATRVIGKRFARGQNNLHRGSS